MAKLKVKARSGKVEVNGLGFYRSSDWDFEKVNAHVNKVKPPTQAQIRGGGGVDACAAYKAARPILIIVGELVLIPAKWRQVIKSLVAAMDIMCPIIGGVREREI